MGGFGTFVYGAANADRFSAFIPVCGGGDTDDAVELARRSMWVFHGADDTVVPPSQSLDMVKAIRDAGGDIQYTEFPGTGHNSWDKAYQDKDAIAWLLRQQRK